MNSPIKSLILLLVLLAGVLFAYSIIQAGIFSLNGKGPLHEFFANAVVVIGGILSTNFGAVLGVTVTPPTNRLNTLNTLVAPTFLGLRSSVTPSENLALKADQQPAEPDPNQKMQVIACWVYVGGLLIAATFYVIAITRKVDPKQIEAIIQQLGKTLIGVIFGAITVALGRK